MKREIQFEILETEWCKLLRIAKQTHRDDDFSRDGGDEFTASNEFRFLSISAPEINPAEENLLFVCGEEKYDNTILVVPSKEWLEKCFAARDEYNALDAE